jgi:hypothetical protein
MAEPNVNAAAFLWLGYGGDDVWSDERVADPLHCARIDSEPLGNDAHTGSPRSRQGLTDSFFECGGNWGPPEALSFTPGPRKPSTDSFRDHRPLEFSKHAQHLKHCFPGGRRRVEPSLRCLEIDGELELRGLLYG